MHKLDIVDDSPDSLRLASEVEDHLKDQKPHVEDLESGAMLQVSKFQINQFKLCNPQCNCDVAYKSNKMRVKKRYKIQGMSVIKKCPTRSQLQDHMNAHKFFAAN